MNGAAAVSADSARVVMETYDSFAAARDLRVEWDSLASELRSPVYLSSAHCEAWWKRYGSGRVLHVLAFRTDGALVGVLPLFSEKVWLGPVCLRLAGIVGSDSTPVVLDLPVRGTRAREVFAAATGHVLRDLGCDAVKFAPLSGESGHAEAIRAAARDVDGLGVVVRDAELGPHSVFHLPPRVEDYHRSLDKKQRGGHRRAMRALEDAYGVAADAVTDPDELAAEFPRFREMHEAQWRAEGKLGHFRDWPQSEEYHLDLVRRHGRDGNSHLLRFRLADEVVAYQLCYSFGETLHWILPARVLRDDLARHSLGRLGVVQLVEYAIGAGFRRVEAGIGHYDYKLQLGATEHRARSIVIAGGVAVRRLRWFTRLAAALDAVYYRAWFKRIAPRLPIPTGPLWNAWIRSRV